MNRDQVLSLLHDHAEELRALGVQHLSLFGSTARGEAGHNSDVDLAARFDDARPLSLLDIIAIEHRLSEILGQPVDLAEESALGRIRAEVGQDAVLVLS